MSQAIGRVERIGRERIAGPLISAKAPIRHLDPTLVLSALGLTALGNLMVYSASRARLGAQGLSGRTLLDRQLVFSAVGLGMMVLLASFSYRRLRAWGPVAYLGGLGALGLVLTSLGSAVAGAQRWIDIGFFRFQPAEFVKVGALIAVALVIADARGHPTAADVAKAVALVTAPALLIYRQPDLGTLLVLVALLMAVLVAGGARVRVLLLLTALGIVGIVGVLHLDLLKEYQEARLVGFLDPSADLQRTGYNLNQSRIGVGSGQIFGKGLFGGSQTNLAFVPEVHTDFIFTAVAEELGFVGAVVLLGLFAVFLWRGARIAMLSKDLFGTLLATGAVGVVAFQMFVNVGMTIGVSPITGIPLPFVSYGGSSLITTYALTGILLNVHMRRL